MNIGRYVWGLCTLTIIQLFERSRFANEIGAAIHLSPNANGVLQRLGIDAAKFGAVECELVFSTPM
jgi:2-polyprenyl-6-methoxyphenol hydroxylase-like FAD-dependent oxidoreductase